MPPTLEGFRITSVVGEPLVIGDAHVVFGLEDAPGVEFVLCLTEARMVGFVVRGEISARTLRKVPLRGLERFAMGFLQQLGDVFTDPEFLRFAWAETGDSTFGAWADSVRTRMETLVRAGTPRQEGLSREEYLALLASRYVQLCAASASPTKALAEALFLSVATVRDQLAAARAAGLLRPAPPGRAGGELTPKAEELLARLQTTEED